MESLHLLQLLLFLLLLSTNGDDPLVGFHGEERNALLALKKLFNDPFLTKNWTGLQCYMNDPPDWYGIQCVNGRVTGISLQHMGLTGKIKADAIYNLTELSFLSFKNNSISGNIMDFTNNQKLKHIDLSVNMFHGPIPSSLLSLNSLESLQLQDNKLSGPVPGFNQSSLKEFNISMNHLDWPGPSTEVLKLFTSSSYFGNLESHDSANPTCNTTVVNDIGESPNENPFKSHIVVIFLVVDVVGLIFVVWLFILYYKKSKKLKEEMKKRYREGEEVAEEENIEAGESEMVAGKEKGRLIFVRNEASFELGDLLKASAEGLGKGNFGTTYKAVLDDDLLVVVKRFRDLKPLTSEEFGKQLQLISQHNHPNLLPPLAYYCSREEKLVVYKFAAKGNLFDRIHGGRGRNRVPFRWRSRLSVAQSVARALEHLHLNTNTETTVAPHGNLKSANILLLEDDTVVVSDYGLTSIIALPIAAQRMVSYKSPEYQNVRKLSKKSDVWSYGCLLLELLTGRIPAHTMPQGNGVDICSWVHRAVREEWTAEVFDYEICTQRAAYEGMLSLLQTAIRCCDKSPENRPEMTEVKKEVENIKVPNSEEDDDFSFDRSYTDDSLSTNPSIILADG